MSSANIIIRKAVPGDASRWAEMLLQLDEEVIYSVFEPGERSTSTHKYEEKIIESQQNQKSAIYFAFDKAIEKEPVVGFVTINANKNRRKDHVATLGIGVLKSYYSQGIANQLGTKIIEHAKSNGLKRIEGYIAACNYKSLKLAEKFGFIVEGRKRNSIKLMDTYQDELLIALDMDTI